MKPTLHDQTIFQIVYTLGAGLGDMLYDMYKLDATAQFRYKNKKWKA